MSYTITFRNRFAQSRGKKLHGEASQLTKRDMRLEGETDKKQERESKTQEGLIIESSSA